MSKHSAIIGGSNAGRLMNCPGSHQAILALPPTLDDLPSEYAAEGTDMHAVMAWTMSGAAGPSHELIDSIVGTAVGDGRVLTREHADTMLHPALDALEELQAHYGGGFEVRGIEQKVKFPGVAGAFGTVDLILENQEYAMLVDWKFGSGVGVQAVYSDPDKASSYVNPQLMYYLAAAIRSYPQPFRKRKLVVAIIQPRGVEPLTHTVVERKEVRWFIEDVEKAVQLAIGRDPPRRKGEWCRFAPCKTTCPLWTGPLLELATLMRRPVDHDGPTDYAYGEYLRHAKALVDTMVILKTTIDEQMHTFLEQGGKIPGWRLKYKTKQRQWVDNDLVAARLRGLGFTEEQIFQQKLVTFQSADATAKKLGVVIPEELRVAPQSTETTLATTDDPAPVVEPKKLIELFSASLQQLRQGAPLIPQRNMKIGD